MSITFKKLLNDIRSCEACAEHLRLPPKPVVQLNTSAKILVIAQAPGIRARESGLPFDDRSGDRLRSWLGLDRTIFYDEKQLAFMPMGFCYPGTAKGGDLPPCKECAPLWHPQVFPHLVNIKLTLLVGIYAQRHYLQASGVTAIVKKWRDHAPSLLPLPHPSWHNNAWIQKNPWFSDELLPTLKNLVATILLTK